MSILISDDHALRAYEALADSYDVLASDYDHERWLARIEQIAVDAGVRGRSVLDVACGTGRSFLPLLNNGWEVSACDMSAGMARHATQAAQVAGRRADVFVADMRDLQRRGTFDLVTCLDDAVNYVHTTDELEATLSGFRRNLASGGIAVWDVNTLVMHRSAFARDWVRDAGDVEIVWRGNTASNLPAGGFAEATVDVFRCEGDTWRRSRGVHRQRHWPMREVVVAAARAGLAIREIFGQHPGAQLVRPADEHACPKLLFVAELAGQTTEEAS